MTNDELARFETLLIEYGNATFACGEFDGDSRAYERFHEKAESARAVVMNIFTTLAEENERLRAREWLGGVQLGERITHHLEQLGHSLPPEVIGDLADMLTMDRDTEDIDAIEKLEAEVERLRRELAIEKAENERLENIKWAKYDSMGDEL